MRIVPYRHTTVVDFLWEYEKCAAWADIVVAHVGIVDFSPRPKRDAWENVYGLKRERYDEVFGREAMRGHLEGCMDCEYEGQPTQNLFSLEMARESLLPRLRSIPNLIFVGCNGLVPGWEGNYTRGRPANMAVVMDYSRLLCGGLARPVAFDDWGQAEIRRYTVDNIHYTPEGGAEVGRRIRAAVERCLVQ
ncbi:MAG: hypothetical protein IT580_13590 [Verrucomicrobiales bacterium]|nr:hypothetical protein [Verrucomicrobiales bacterium]